MVVLLCNQSDQDTVRDLVHLTVDNLLIEIDHTLGLLRLDTLNQLAFQFKNIFRQIDNVDIGFACENDVDIFLKTVQALHQGGSRLNASVFNIPGRCQVFFDEHLGKLGGSLHQVLNRNILLGLFRKDIGGHNSQ